MSADNYVAVKEIDGMWHVWMVLGGYEKSDWDVPSGHYHKFFEEELNAHHYAHQVCGATVVEYGVVLMPVSHNTRENESMSLSEVKEKYLPNRDIADLRKKPDISLLKESD